MQVGKVGLMCLERIHVCFFFFKGQAQLLTIQEWRKA